MVSKVFPLFFGGGWVWAVEDVKFWDENLIAKFSVQDLLNCFRTRGALHVKKGSILHKVLRSQ